MDLSSINTSSVEAVPTNESVETTAQSGAAVEGCDRSAFTPIRRPVPLRPAARLEVVSSPLPWKDAVVAQGEEVQKVLTSTSKE